MKLFLLVATVAAAPAAAFTTGFAPSRTTSLHNIFQLNAESSDFAADGVANGTDKKKVIVLGGDGFCGWPTSLYLSDQGHDVVVVDNLSRRNIDTELGCDSLTPIQPPDVSLFLVALGMMHASCVNVSTSLWDVVFCNIVEYGYQRVN